MKDKHISDFIAHRWVDGKDELSKLDPRYVRTLENELIFDRIGLYSPTPTSLHQSPMRRLSSDWHRLLEECVELEIVVGCLESAAQLLTPSRHIGKSVEEIGREAIYHFRSWFVHAQALAEKSGLVIEITVKLLGKGQSELIKRFKDQVYSQITSYVEKQRQNYVHARRSWASGMTEDQLWEAAVALSYLPTRLLRAEIYPKEGEKIQRGLRAYFETVTNDVVNRLGAILHQLEVALGR